MLIPCWIYQYSSFQPDFNTSHVNVNPFLGMSAIVRKDFNTSHVNVNLDYEDITDAFRA